MTPIRVTALTIEVVQHGAVRTILTVRSPVAAPKPDLAPATAAK